MRIISKYKDFYDFIIQDHDTDLIYVRNIGLINEYLDDMFRKEGNAIPYYYKYGRRHKNGDLEFDNLVFGIYPFVFSQPILKIFYKNKLSGNTESIFIILGRELVDKLLDSNKIVSEAAFENELIPFAQDIFDTKHDKEICDSTKVSFLTYYKFENIQKSLRIHIWKVDCPEIFYKIESPVFVKYYNELFVDGAYWGNWPEKHKIGNSEYTHYVTDISFQKLNHNILKYWYDDVFDINTYINIENFLWSIKQEPEANPDNKTKIVAHGFDLKTSFRKM